MLAFLYSYWDWSRYCDFIFITKICVPQNLVFPVQRIVGLKVTLYIDQPQWNQFLSTDGFPKTFREDGA